jgi:hypothetical protein
MDWKTYYSGPDLELPGVGSEVRVYMERLEHKLNSLALASQAMWELLQENSELSEADLARRMEAIDLRDGVADGKITHSVIECPHCQRKTTQRRPNCMYCGQPIGPEEEVFGRD